MTIDELSKTDETFFLQNDIMEEHEKLECMTNDSSIL